MPIGGNTEVRFIYCGHQHDEGEPCNDLCHHDERCRHTHRLEKLLKGAINV